ncbi:MAG: PLP-dependent aminotransferase family protein [Coriobacteriales bacterium]|jgi:DNA-binding transcriptional MocR family regulator
MPINSFDDYPMSWRPKKEELKRPYYISLADLMEQDIRTGKLAPNAKLPPQRELADFLDLNLSTISKTYKLCEARGLVTAVVGRGTFVTLHAPVTTSVVEEHPGANIELGTIYPFYEHNAIVRDVARDILSQDDSAKLFEYADPLGSKRQSAIGAKWLKHLGVDADGEDTIIASGVQNALADLLVSLFEPGDKIVVDEYTYPNFISLCSLLHLHLIPLGEGEGGLDVEALENICITQKPQGIYLMPSGSNPTNVSLSGKVKEQVADIVKRYGLIVLEDDNYSALLEGPLDPLVNYLPDSCVYISGFSKPVCSGLRIAYMRVPRRLREKVVHGAVSQNLKIPSLNIEIATQLVERGLTASIAKDKRRLSIERNGIFKEVFPESACHDVSFCQWIDLPDGCTGKSCEVALANQGVNVFGAERFAASGDASAAHLRIATCSPSTASELRRGLGLVRSYLDSFGQSTPRFIV